MRKDIPVNEPLHTARNSPSCSHGFSLIEFAAIVAITVVIGAVGVSAVRTYIVRAQIAESVAQAGFVQESVTNAFRSFGVPPVDGQAASLTSRAKEHWADYIDSMDVVNGRIDIRFGGTAHSAIAERTLSLTPFETADQQVVWVCGNKIPGVGLSPLGFAGGSRQAVQVLTTIEARYLPPTCR